MIKYSFFYIAFLPKYVRINEIMTFSWQNNELPAEIWPCQTTFTFHAKVGPVGFLIF